MVDIGKILKCFREEKNIKKYQVCEGVCSSAFLSQIENGEKIPDALLFEHIMERIGVSSEDFAVMATEEEYEFFVWRETIYEAIEEKRVIVLKELLNNSKNIGGACSLKIISQMQFYIKGVLEVVEQNNYKSATEYFKMAALQTIPKMFESLGFSNFFGIKELHLLMLYAFYGVKARTIEKNVAKELFYKIEECILKNKMELQEQAKIYPKLVCMMIHTLGGDMTLREQRERCEIAIELLRLTRRFYDVTELLCLYSSILKKEKNQEALFYEKQYRIFIELFDIGMEDASFRPEYIVIKKPKVYLITEYLNFKRKERKWTHEQISVDIYDPASYSRVERGVTKPFPKKLKVLTEKLGIPWCYYRGELQTNNPDVYRLRKMSRDAVLSDEWEEDIKILEEMEKMLDMGDVINYQYIESKKSIAFYYIDKLSIEEAYFKMKELLELTIDMKKEDDLVYYTQTELEIITYMAQMHGKRKNYTAGITLLESVLRQMSRSKMDFQYQWNGVDFALRVLSGLYFEIEEYEKSLEIGKYVFKINMKIRDGGNLPTILDGIADNLEHMGERYSEKYKQLYRQTYYIASFYGVKDVEYLAKKYYENNFEQNYVWY